MHVSVVRTCPYGALVRQSNHPSFVTELRRELVIGMPMLLNVSSYLGTNLFETTSGNFATDLLQFHMKEIGLDRITFSIDYPYVTIEEGTEWVESLSSVLTPEEHVALKRGNAIKLLKLND